ncbi:MAG: tetratricopeptide repeat protein, partial [Vampirovibrionia bacterium]
MSFFNKMTSKVQDTASATKLLAKLKQGKSISGQVIEAYIKNDLIKVISLVESILEEESEDRKSDSYFTMGTMCQNANKIDLAEDCYNKSNGFKESGKNYEHLSEIYIDNDDAKALEALNKALALNNESENIYKMLISLYRKQKNYEKLMDAVWAFIKKYSKKDWAWESKTCVFNQEGWNNLLDLKTPGSALVFVLKEAMETESPERVITLSD